MRREKAERLMRIIDLATYKVVVFSRKVELIRVIEKERQKIQNNGVAFPLDVEFETKI